jgi:2-polyprenyl-6-methoxyphenol hydroxylase-like FAD-dependent oxidoreductase
MKTQVLIVGAGPVGLTMAMELARYGVSVRIVERRHSALTNPRQSCCGAEL